MVTEVARSNGRPFRRRARFNWAITKSKTVDTARFSFHWVVSKLCKKLRQAPSTADVGRRVMRMSHMTSAGPSSHSSAECETVNGAAARAGDAAVGEGARLHQRIGKTQVAVQHRVGDH